MSDSTLVHFELARHADFIECYCGHLSVTDTDHASHLEDVRRRPEVTS
jgi:hypothetical protein